MLGKIKNAIQGRLYKNCIEEYQKELRSQTDPYLLWIKETEQPVNTQQEFNAKIGVIDMENCGKNFSLSHITKDYLVFVSEEGRIAPNAFREIVQYFETHKDQNIVYADEDVWMLIEGENKETAHRIFPWTKPVWSPDTLFSFFYFGNIFAVRKAAFAGISWLGDEDYKKNIYDFVLKATECEGQPGHIEKVLFHAYKKGSSKEAIEQELMHSTDFIGVGSAYDGIRESALSRRRIAGKMILDNQTGISYPVYETPHTPLVSIIIPSKDNPKILEQCIRSIYAHTDYPNFEILVVDNGSAEHVRAELEEFQMECRFAYLYQPMDFNFSRMCNLGVSEAKGEYILLLNDDMEAIQDSWLTRMMGQAALEHVGSVGSKLLYPNSTLIQHTGISNTISGPGHKLKKMEDTVSYYYGRNRFIYDMIGVTGACLLMKKRHYMELGGLYEGLAVAYNDVDLCFRLYDKGLYNVLRNDVVLYHHESLSRGDDMQDEKKLKRLTKEKDLLYQRHNNLYRKDPFIGTLMNDGESEYHCRWLEGYELVNLSNGDSNVQEAKRLPPPAADGNRCRNP